MVRQPPHSLTPAPDPSVPATDAARAEDALQLLALPVAWADDRGALLGANAAFEAVTGLVCADQIGRRLVDLLGLTTADTGLAASVQGGQRVAAQPWVSVSAAGLALRGRLSQQCQPGLRVLSLQIDTIAVDAVASDTTETLAIAKQLGRFGTWRHDLQTGERHWDEQLWRFMGLPLRPGAPQVDAALAMAHADDHDGLKQAFFDSITQPGRYSHSWRLQAADGVLRHVRSLWQVKAGLDGRPQRLLGMMVDETESVQLAHEADEAQAQLKLAITVADIAVWHYDAPSRRFQLSAQAWALLGLAPVAGGLSLPMLLARLHPDDMATLRSQLRGVLGVQAGPASPQDLLPLDLGLRCRRPDGLWRYLLTRRVRRRDAQGRVTGHVGVALDLSDRYNQQQQALSLAKRLELVTAAAGLGVWSMQLGDSPVLIWDAQMRALHGLAPEQPPPTPANYVDQHVVATDRAWAAAQLARLMSGDLKQLDLDWRVVWPDGQVRRLTTRTSVSGPIGQRWLHGVMLDVSERHATEERLRQVTERAALAARGAGIGTWESDAEAQEGWWDEQMFRLRGRESAPRLVKTDDMAQWVHPDDRQAIRESMRSAVAADAPSNAEFRVVWPDGTVRWLATRSLPVHDEGGRTLRRIGVNWDITDARNAAAIRQERLLAQHESQAKSRFLARISHELRTPLNAVLGFAQLLLAETPAGAAPDPAVWRRRVEHVQASGEHLLALIDDVLELSSLQSGELPLDLRPVALAPLAETSLPLVEMMAREHGVRLELGPLDGWVMADPVRLRQALFNLLTNAIKYNHRGGLVRLSAEPSAAPSAEPSGDPGVERLLLRVQDNGRGLSDEQLRHVFEPFNRLGMEREGIVGTGIGLAIVQASVQHMGGTVQVHSRPGEGSVFELSLLRAAPPQPAPPPAAALAPAPAPQQPELAGHCLLYIEDNEVNLLIVSELLKRRPDLRLLSAVDGASGVALARAQQPALILLDMQLPDMDGHEVMRRLRADPSTAAIRCIALSANAMPEDLQRARESGVDDYWTKPLNLAGFMRSLDALFGPAPLA